MKLLLIILCALMVHCSDGYPSIDGEVSEDVLPENDISVEYSLDTTNDTYSNDSLIQHGFFKKVGNKVKGGIKSIKDKIGSFKDKIGGFKDNSGSGRGIGGGRYIGGIRKNSGSGTANPETTKWVLIGIGVVVLVSLVGLSLYYWQTRTKRDTNCEFQQVNKT